MVMFFYHGIDGVEGIWVDYDYIFFFSFFKFWNLSTFKKKYKSYYLDMIHDMIWFTPLEQIDSDFQNVAC